MRTLFVALLLPALALGGCRKKSPKDEGAPIEALPSPDDRLQVAGLDPAFAPADTSVDADVFGSGFQEGAKVAFSGAAADGVRFVDENDLHVVVPSMPVGSYDVTVTNPDGSKATLRKALTLTAQQPYAAACPSVTVHFEFDSSVLTIETRRQLDALAQCLRDGGTAARVEGHCDEKGTTDYNIALGQRRADSVQRYLVGLGVSPAHLRAISFGEERPVDRAGTPAADAANRRAEIIVGS